MDTLKKQRSAKIHARQYDLLLEAVENNKQLKTGAGNPTTLKESWEKLSGELNSIGAGPVKTAAEWRKALLAWKNATRHKARMLMTYGKGTGGGPANLKMLTPVEDRLMSAFGKEVLAGSGIKNPSQMSDAVQFMFEEIIEEDLNAQCDDGVDGDITLSSQSLLQSPSPLQLQSKLQSSGVGIKPISTATPTAQQQGDDDVVLLSSESPDIRPSPSIVPTFVRNAESMAMRGTKRPARRLNWSGKDGNERSVLNEERLNIAKAQTESINRLADKVGELAAATVSSAGVYQEIIKTLINELVKSRRLNE